MKYRIQTDTVAERQISKAFWYIYDDSPTNAKRWLQGLYEAIDSLETMPDRCLIARESEIFGGELRQLIYQSHRVIFTISGQTVRVMHVRHGARGELENEK